jgi:putative ABC transport system permease protein
MFWNNVKIALRNIRKNKVFATINILGLAIGMTVFVFGGLLLEYERTHDAFFEKVANTYTIGAHAAPELGLSFDSLNATFSAVAPIIETEFPDVEAVARTVLFEYLVTMGADSFYQNMRFADPAILEIFDFDYLHGDASALDSPSGFLITESTAIKYFGKTDVLGETVTLDNEFDYQVTAVIADVPLNSHFNSMIVTDAVFGVIAPLSALNRMREYDMAGDWNNLSLGNMTYVLLPTSLNGEWLQNQMDSIFERVVPDDQKEVIADFIVIPMQHANLSIWDTFGLPMVTIIQLLSFLVLVVACVNYTNLATAQSLGRSREVGMRKTMGAGQGQLLVQFLSESLVVATIGMIVAVALLELTIPLFNNAANKVMTVNYLQTMPWLILTTILVGLGAGLYPAWLITRASPIDALRDTARKGKKGSMMRSLMIGSQFAISAFMLAIVTVVYMQNQLVQESSYEFPRSEIYTLGRLRVESIQDKFDTLRYELEALPNVDSVSFSSQVPYEQSNSSTNVSLKPADEAGKIKLQVLRMTPEFLDAYGISLLAGRNIGWDIANDEYHEDAETLNVLVNEMALESLGIASPEDAINQRFYDLDDEDALREFLIVGVVPTQNIVGLFNADKPWMYFNNPDSLQTGSVRITGGNMIDVVEQIEDVWKRVIPDYPIQGKFLDEVFDDIYNVLRFMNMVLAGFAFITLALALIGLFGLAAFMATQRTKEIGVRKVLGANSLQIARLLVWQFSKPALWALLVALPLAYFASNMYLDFFAERIGATFLILLASGLVAVMFAWGTVAGHAIRIARRNPILALRYE